MFLNFCSPIVLHIKDHGNHCIHDKKQHGNTKKDEPYRANHRAINLMFPKTINLQNNVISNNCKLQN